MSNLMIAFGIGVAVGVIVLWELERIYNFHPKTLKKNEPEPDKTYG